MSPNLPRSSRADSPAAALQGLASRAYRLLRQGRPEDRDELRDLLDEIGRSRRLFEGIASEDLRHWFDRLEAEVAGSLEPIDEFRPRIEPSNRARVGVA
ncbi:hypothetical protein [Tautonia sociabilis]|uniref:Uncharacterized protein n=1 Tax=Tautonia sociabilis TaxID=2080755 RepID=A0A432MJJ3_9BACT|nr:hypothetical protein [Tautonia sociabilis]RUL87420.1 hypothetical protein TsocGM_12120 [Tautonia sociabilis]